eukprot:TRINITY_DN15553_c0_g1_i1.p1 TRINITY_DN15553_c0_g1~~TRINITY_DN15553_c0_g1_i1.p1  ORF type:complete len:257 (+),score=55.05 TRINITY_DN15553_c0_g1_i1:11-781(+)
MLGLTFHTLSLSVSHQLTRQDILLGIRVAKQVLLRNPDFQNQLFGNVPQLKRSLVLAFGDEIVQDPAVQRAHMRAIVKAVPKVMRKCLAKAVGMLQAGKYHPTVGFLHNKSPSPVVVVQKSSSEDLQEDPEMQEEESKSFQPTSTSSKDSLLSAVLEWFADCGKWLLSVFERQIKSEEAPQGDDQSKSHNPNQRTGDDEEEVQQPGEGEAAAVLNNNKHSKYFNHSVRLYSFLVMFAVLITKTFHDDDQRNNLEQT